MVVQDPILLLAVVAQDPIQVLDLPLGEAVVRVQVQVEEALEVENINKRITPKK